MRRFVVFVVTLMMALVSTVVFSPSAGADCSDVGVASGFRLLANREPVSGAYALTLPAGEYRLVMTSADDHHPTSDGLQTAEQWYFITDSGFTSPITPDLPDGELAATFDMGVYSVPETSSITFHHGQGGPGAQSVTPSVSFVCPAEAPATTEPATTTVAPTTAPPVTEAPTSVAPTPTVVPGPDSTVPAAPAPTTPDPTAAPTTEPPALAPPSSDVNDPGDVLPAPSIVPPTTAPDTVAAPTTTEEGAVLPITITPDPPSALPRTGAETLHWVWIAALLIVTGSISVVISRPQRTT